MGGEWQQRLAPFLRLSEELRLDELTSVPVLSLDLNERGELGELVYRALFVSRGVERRDLPLTLRIRLRGIWASVNPRRTPRRLRPAPPPDLAPDRMLMAVRMVSRAVQKELGEPDPMPHPSFRPALVRRNHVLAWRLLSPVSGQRRAPRAREHRARRARTGRRARAAPSDQDGESDPDPLRRAAAA